MDPKGFENEFKRIEEKAEDYVRRKGLKKIGKSYSEILKQLEECITQKHSYYKAIIDQKVDAAYEAALKAYTKKLNEIYKTYQKPESEKDNHGIAWKEALAAYRELGVGELMSENENEALKKMKRKRKECSESNDLKKKNGDKKNNAAHDKALTSYRDGMQEGYANIFGFMERHEKAQSNACDDYENGADGAFSSYEENKADLLKGIDVIRHIYEIERGLGNWFKSFFGKQTYVVIPDYLLKTKTTSI